MTEKEFTWKGFHWRIGHPWGITHPKKNNSWFGPEAVDINSDDTMYLSVIHKENNFPEGTKPWCVGLVTSKDKLTYGTYTWKAKLPVGTNLWPALWVTAHDSWPPEIDMVEGYTYPKNYDYIKNSIETRLETNVHFHYEGNEHDHLKAKGIPTIIYKLFGKKNKINTYSFTWTENYIKFYFNGILFRTVKDKKALGDLNQHPFVYPIMNLEINDEFSNKDYFCDPVFEIYDFNYKKLN